ncbi:MAG: hypothetical protein L3J59_07630 [Methylococcaceae bacterium]|nr:hypothetical protein [Methylococcaceae bacterium]
MAKPFRSRSKFLTTTFTAINRPEDVPYTLIWLPTEIFLMSSILFFMKMQLADYQQSILLYIIILITGIGDTDTEPIGIRFGKHRYKVRSFASDREYTRSLEGKFKRIYYRPYYSD